MTSNGRGVRGAAGRVLPRQTLSADERAAVVRDVLRFLETWQPKPAQIMTTGSDGEPQLRLMSARNVGFDLYLLSIKPSAKLDELAANPAIRVCWYQYDADPYEYEDPANPIPRDPALATPAFGPQPLRLVEVRGSATILNDVAAIRAMPGRTLIAPMADAVVAERYAGIVVTPHRIRAEGFRPGPRFPVFLDPADAALA